MIKAKANESKEELPGVRSISGAIRNVWKTGEQTSILILVLQSRVY